MSETGKRKRRSRKTKEEKALDFQAIVDGAVVWHATRAR